MARASSSTAALRIPNGRAGSVAVDHPVSEMLHRRSGDGIFTLLILLPVDVKDTEIECSTRIVSI